MTQTRSLPHTGTPRTLLWGGVCGSLLALLCFAPAQWLAQAIEAATGEHVQLRQVRGTVWDGSAQWVLAAGSGGREALALPQRVHWQLRPLWNASLQLQLQVDCCTAQAVDLLIHADLQGLHITLNNADSAWPAQWFSGLGAPWNTLNLQGRLVLSSRQLQVHWNAKNWQLSGAATLELRQLSSGLSMLKPLGSYVLHLQGGASPGLQLSTREGRLQLQGQGSWQAGRLRFAGEARAQAGHETALRNLLGVLGQWDGDKTMLKLG